MVRTHRLKTSAVNSIRRLAEHILIADQKFLKGFIAGLTQSVL